MRIIIALIASAVAVVAADVAKSLPENTTMVARFDLPEVRNSTIMTKIIDKNFERYVNLLESVESTMGIKLEDVETVWMTAVKMNQGAIILDGNIAVDKVRAKAEAAAAKHDHVVVTARDDFPLVVNYADDKSNMTVAVKSGRLIVGNSVYVGSLLNVLLGAEEAISDNPLLDQLSSSKDPVAMAMLSMNEDLANRNRDLATMVQSGFASFAIDDSVSAKFELNTANVDQADGLHMIAMGMIAMQSAQLQQMQSDPENHSAQEIRKAMVMTELMKTAKISRKDATVHADWTLSESAKKLISETAQTELPDNLATP